MLCIRNNLTIHKCIYIKTKSDLGKVDSSEIINVSSKNRFGFDVLKNEISTTLSTLHPYDYSRDVLITSRRQQALISNSVDKITSLIDLVNKDFDMVILSTLLRSVSDDLGELVGKIYNEQLLDSIFNEFCVGK